MPMSLHIGKMSRLGCLIKMCILHVCRKRTLTPGKMQEAMVSLSTLGYQTWGEPAALTDGGTSGGLMCAAKKHINFRLHSSFTVEGKDAKSSLGGSQDGMLP